MFYKMHTQFVKHDLENGSHPSFSQQQSTAAILGWPKHASVNVISGEKGIQFPHSGSISSFLGIYTKYRLANLAIFNNLYALIWIEP